MTKRGILLGILFLAALAAFLASFSEANVIYKNNTIEKEYSAGEAIRGNVNLSFDNELAQSLFKSNFPGNISLLDLLKANSFEEGKDYNCTTKDCISDYIIKAEINSFFLNESEKKAIGFKITGEDIEIKSLKLILKSDAQPACYRQIVIDALGKNENLIQNSRYTNYACGYTYRGCFEPDAEIEQADIDEVPYCENITLPYGPAFQLGAKVMNSSKQGNLKMQLFNQDRELLGSCILPKHKIFNENLGCIVNYSSTEASNYFVCISLDSGSNTNYTIASENSGRICGMAGIEEEFSRDFDIFAKEMQFDSVDIEIAQPLFEKLFSGASLIEYAQNYIDEKYNKDCKKGCFIPFEVQGDVPQTITILNPEIKYSAKRVSSTASKIYVLEKESPKIKSRFLNINIEHAGFSIPLGSKENKFSLYLENNILFQIENLTISPSFSFDISPKTLMIAFKTEFKIDSKESIASSNWKFGSESSKTVKDKKIKWIFYNEGIYPVEVTATNKKGVTSKRKFYVIVGNAKEAAELLASDYQKDLNNFFKQINSYPQWIKEGIDKKINFTEINTSFSEIKNKMNETQEVNYSKVVAELSNLKIPSEIFASKSWKNLPLEISAAQMDVGYIETISNMSAVNKEELKLNILNWAGENYASNISGELISLKVQDENEPILTKFLVSFEAKREQSEAYFIIDYPRNQVVFAKDYGARDINSDSASAAHIPFAGSKTFEFLILQEIEPSQIRLYLSPNIAMFNEESNVTPVENPKPKKAGWGYFFLVLGMLIVYIAMQEWYKRRYEFHLFKIKDDLYNLINFIYNSRASGMADSSIKAKLEDSGWSSEQVSFAFKKINGKRTGMFEIPIFKFFENLKVKKEIDKRQQTGDARFIKRL
ncbi:MAG: PKD domain-containing protein [Nanoarchaeota archaeon]